MVRFIMKSAALVAALAIAAFAPTHSAKAWGTSYYGGYYGYYDDFDLPPPPYYSVYPGSYYVYEYEAPVYYAPPPAVYYGRPAPWTDEWYDYCASKYRSFDPVSGTFQPYHGRRRLCR